MERYNDFHTFFLERATVQRS